MLSYQLHSVMRDLALDNGAKKTRPTPFGFDSLFGKLAAKDCIHLPMLNLIFPTILAQLKKKPFVSGFELLKWLNR